MADILFILSAAARLSLRDGDSVPTGFWAQEFVPPWRIFARAGHRLTVATPGGAAAVIDELCFDPQFHNGDSGVPRRLRAELDTLDAWRTPWAVESLLAQGRRFDAVFFPGGHGPVVDLADHVDTGRLVADCVRRDGIVGAICHGPAGLLTARDAQRRWLFAGRQLTCFSPDEEVEAGLAERLPWLLADRLAALGGILSYAPNGQARVVADGPLFTGQNPASAIGLASAMLAGLN